MYITRIRLENIRRFKSRVLDFSRKGDSHDPRMTTLLIGKNGTCKTTLLRSIVIGLCDRAEGNALLAEGIGIIGDKQLPAEIEIDLWDPDKQKGARILTKLKSRDGQDEVVEQKPREFESPFACGYGVGRCTVGAVDPGYRLANSTYTLFRYDSNLTYAELALRRLKDFVGSKKYARTMKGIKRSIGISATDQIDFERGGGVVLKSKSLGAVPLGDWADGHRVSFNLILDVYSWAMQADAVTEDGGVRGILLIDEIGQFLHPSLELEVITRIRSLFRYMQLIVTSHSPMVALGTQQGELIALRARGKSVIADGDLPDLGAYSVEDVVADPALFDSTVYTPEISEKLSAYRKLCGKSENLLTSAERKTMKELASELAAHQIPEARESTAVNEMTQLLKKYDL